MNIQINSKLYNILNINGLNKIINNFLSDIENINLINVFSKTDNMLCNFLLKETYHIKKVINSRFKNNFTSLIILESGEIDLLYTEGNLNFPNLVDINFHFLYNFIEDLHLKIPKKLKNIIFYEGSFFNQEVDFSEFTKLEKLCFGYIFDKNLDNKLPTSLKTLIFDKSSSFDKELNFSNLSNLEEINFGFSFDRNLDYKLPTSIKSIEFSPTSIFSQSTDFSNLTNLENIVFGINFENQIESGDFFYIFHKNTKISRHVFDEHLGFGKEYFYPEYTDSEYNFI